MTGEDPPAVVTPRSVGVLVGGACLVALAVAAYDAGGSIPAAEGGALLDPVGFVLLVVGLVIVSVWARRRFRPSPPTQRERGLTLDESDIRALLARWYPDWKDRQLDRVAETISYHRQRAGPDD